MRSLTTAIILATTALATTAFAGERLTDTQFVKAAYCRGLTGDAAVATSLDAVLKTNEQGRLYFVIDQARTARQEGRREVRRSTGPAGKAEIARQLSGPCAALAG